MVLKYRGLEIEDLSNPASIGYRHQRENIHIGTVPGTMYLFSLEAHGVGSFSYIVAQIHIYPCNADQIFEVILDMGGQSN